MNSVDKLQKFLTLNLVVCIVTTGSCEGLLQSKTRAPEHRILETVCEFLWGGFCSLVREVWTDECETAERHCNS